MKHITMSQNSVHGVNSETLKKSSIFPPIFDTIHLYNVVPYIKMAKHKIVTGFASPILCFQDALQCL